MSERRWKVYAAYSVGIENDPHPRVAHYPAPMHTVTDEELPTVLAADGEAFASTQMWLVMPAAVPVEEPETTTADEDMGYVESGRTYVVGWSATCPTCGSDDPNVRRPEYIQCGRCLGYTYHHIVPCGTTGPIRVCGHLWHGVPTKEET